MAFLGNQRSLQIPFIRRSPAGATEKNAVFVVCAMQTFYPEYALNPDLAYKLQCSNPISSAK
jgi:hypothetical protein